MSSVAFAAAGAMAGGLTWSFTEYATHRWALHGPFGHGALSRVPIGSIHRNHHRDPNHTVTLARAGAHVAMAGVGAAAARMIMTAAPSVPTALAVAAGAAWSAGYSAYDIVHHRLHHREPTTARGVRLRQRHFRHHFGGPRGNLGVTTGLWDRVFGTEIVDRPVTVTERFAPPWLDTLGPRFGTTTSRAQAAHV